MFWDLAEFTTFKQISNYRFFIFAQKLFFTFRFGGLYLYFFWFKFSFFRSYKCVNKNTNTRSNKRVFTYQKYDNKTQNSHKNSRCKIWFKHRQKNNHRQNSIFRAMWVIKKHFLSFHSFINYITFKHKKGLVWL